MIKSMTGFAALTREDASATVSVTIKSVNHRFLDLQLRVPSMLQHLEGPMRARVQSSLARGRVEIGVTVQLRKAMTYDVHVNEAIVAALDAATARLRVSGVVSGHLTLSDLLRIPQAVTVREVPAEARASGVDAQASGDDAQAVPDDAQVAGGGTPADALVLSTLSEALTALDAMRATEGGLLGADLAQRLALLGALVEQIVEDAQSAQDLLQARLQERVSALNIEPAADHAALASEIVRFVARSDIQEEVVRFRSHLTHWRALVDGAEPCGRKLDFLLQEMNREVNTIGSKAEGTLVPAHVVTAKAELERLKEQVQNVE